MTILLSLFLSLLQAAGAPPAAKAEYTIEAIRFGTLPNVRATVLLPVGANPEERLDIAVVIWLIRGNGKNILFDTGYHRQTPGFTERWNTSDYVRPDEAVKLAGVQPDEITDIIVSHVHWDHMGSLDLFPKATVWIQKEEYQYYTGPAYQPGGRRGGEAEDLIELVRRNLSGKVVLIDGDDREIMPGIRAYTGARHTYSSQYVRVEGNPTYVLASDNCYLYRNLDNSSPSATFDAADRAGNVASQTRMIKLAGAKERVVPGHDMLQFSRFPTKGRIARIK
ncbi:MAG: N-acyl homoserine lactonase family protein [Acidobacteria bacterium]|nr:N-acyl homoserine lactonase family protein [Acidobacteriota bacterium]